MIGISLQGQLGNQLFQYAAARVTAERLGCGLVVHRGRIGRRQLFRFVGTTRIRAEIGEVFPSVRQTRAGVALQLIAENAGQQIDGRIHRYLFPRNFAPRRMTIRGISIEIFDPELMMVRPGTWISGFFQSRLYFLGFENAIERWFRLPKDRQNDVDRLLETFPAPPENMVAVHVRRSDYLTQRGPLADPQLGWALPIQYYQKAITQLPEGVKFAVFSDDEAFARDSFSALDPWFSAAGDAATDLFLMASCRYMIIANSSFSWWAAWLNRIHNKVIIAPRYHVGWYVNTWYPGNIDVPTWNYVDPSQNAVVPRIRYAF